MSTLAGSLRAIFVTLVLSLLLLGLVVRVGVRFARELTLLPMRPSAASAAVWLLVIFATLGPLGGQARAAESGGSLASLFKRVDRAVVVVRTAGHAPGPWVGQTMTTSGVASGVLIGSDGRVLTAAHVVQTADAVAVEFASGEIVRAQVAAADPAADVAVLQLDSVPAGIAPVKLGDSDDVSVGDEIFVVGTPLGIGHTLTVGHISGRRKSNATFSTLASAELFQTDAAINQGNSGGPMFNLAGEAIGVVSHIVSRSGGSEGLGFAVTSNAARRAVIDEPSVWTGLEGYLLTDRVAEAFNVPHGAAGLLVQRVAEGSPAQRFGLRPGTLPIAVSEERLLIGGDIILAVDGIGLDAADAYASIRRRLIELHARRASVHVTVLRGGETLDLTASI
jgi:serine protease Do